MESARGSTSSRDQIPRTQHVCCVRAYLGLKFGMAQGLGRPAACVPAAPTVQERPGADGPPDQLLAADCEQTWGLLH